MIKPILRYSVIYSKITLQVTSFFAGKTMCFLLFFILIKPILCLVVFFKALFSDSDNFVKIAYLNQPTVTRIPMSLLGR